MPKLIKIFVNAIFQSTVISISYYKIFCSNEEKCCSNCKKWCSNEEKFCCNGKICGFKPNCGDYCCCLHVFIILLFNVIPIVCFYRLNAGFYLSFLVTIVASFVYLQICLVVKNKTQNKIYSKIDLVCISINFILSGVSWIAALVYFSIAPTDWKAPASKSRELNHECVVGIYDGHDIWHILSSTALFLSFMFVFCNDKIMLVSIEEKIKDEESSQTNGRSGGARKNDETEERKKLNETDEIGTST